LKRYNIKVYYSLVGHHILLGNEQMRLLFYTRLIIGIFLVSLLVGCTSNKALNLMPTPVIYQNSLIDPFAHLTPEHKSPQTHVFYATNRAPKSSNHESGYGNNLDSIVHLGKATIRMGTPDIDWDDLYKSSLSSTEINSLPLTLEAINEIAVLPAQNISTDNIMTPELRAFVDAINAELAVAIDKEIMVYVHGTKVDFVNAAILTAEIDHFAGRDFVGLAFAWPSHQNILLYLSGIDVRRALNSTRDLQSLLVILAEYTDAKHINILSYSAGGRVTSKALFEMRQDFSTLSAEELKEKFRLGAIVFAAADVEVDKFLSRLPAISNLADQVVITVTDDDYALKAAKKYMHGAVRAGTSEAEMLEENLIVNKQLSNVEIIDVSKGQEIRGFDITGHHYWYRHPWMSSDIIFLMRTNLPPHRRGLSATELEGIWYLAEDYPEKIKNAAEIELGGQW
jgi:esterase/lipase superfamily enzyme